MDHAGALAARALFAADEHVLRDRAMVPPGQRCAPVRTAHLLALDPSFGMAPCEELSRLMGVRRARANATLLQIGSHGPGGQPRDVLLFQPLSFEAPASAHGHRLLLSAFAQQHVSAVVLVHERQALVPPLDMFESSAPVLTRGPGGATVETVLNVTPRHVTVALSQANEATGTQLACRFRVHRLSLSDDVHRLFHKVRSIHEASRQDATVAIGCADGSDHSGIFALLLHQRAEAHQRHAAGQAVDAPALVRATLEMMVLGRSRRGTGFADSVGAPRFSELLQQHADRLASEFSPSRCRQRAQAKALAEALTLVRARRQAAALPPPSPASPAGLVRGLPAAAAAPGPMAAPARPLAVSSQDVRLKRQAAGPAAALPRASTPTAGATTKPSSRPSPRATDTPETSPVLPARPQRVAAFASPDVPPRLPPRATISPPSSSSSAPPPLPPRSVDRPGRPSGPVSSSSTGAPSASRPSASSRVTALAGAGPNSPGAAHVTGSADDDLNDDQLVPLLHALSSAELPDEVTRPAGPLWQRLADLGETKPKELAQRLERHVQKVVKALLHPRPWAGLRPTSTEDQHQAVLWQVRELNEFRQGLGPAVFSEDGPFKPTSSGTEEQVMSLLTGLFREAYAALPPHRQNRWRERVDVRGPIQAHLSAVVDGIHRRATHAVPDQTLAHRRSELQALLFSHAVLQAVARAPGQTSD